MNFTPYVADFAIVVDSLSRLVAAFSRQLNDVAITYNMICLIAVADGRLDVLVTALSSWWSAYWSTVLKSDQSVLLRIGFVMWAPTMTVISAAIAPLTTIAVRQAVFCLYASSWALALVVISGVTTQSVVLAVAAIDYFLMSLLLIATLYLYSISAFGLSLTSPTMPSADSSNI